MLFEDKLASVNNIVDILCISHRTKYKVLHLNLLKDETTQLWLLDLNW